MLRRQDCVVGNSKGKVLRKQDCLVGNSKGCGRVVLWEDVGRKAITKLCSVMVQSYRGIEYLSIGRDGEISSVDNIGEVADVDLLQPIIMFIVDSLSSSSCISGSLQLFERFARR